MGESFRQEKSSSIAASSILEIASPKNQALTGRAMNQRKPVITKQPGGN